jgi:hypothetical protein
MAKTIIEIKTGNKIENVPEAKAEVLVNSKRYFYEGEKVEVSTELANEIFEAEKQALISEREELELDRADLVIKRANFEIEKQQFEAEKQALISERESTKIEKVKK